MGVVPSDLRTYLDHAATTPLMAEAREVIATQLGLVGNPSSLHASGRAARRVVEESRETIAARLGARPAEVIFTSGALRPTTWPSPARTVLVAASRTAAES